MGLAARIFLLGTAFCAFVFAQSHFAGGGAHSPGISSTLGGHAFSVPRGTPASSGLTSYPSGFTGINPGALRSFGKGFYGRGRDGRGRGVPPVGYLWAPYYYPFFDYDSGYGPAYDSYGAGAPDPNLQGAIVGQNMLGEQVQRLTAELDELRGAQQNPYAPPPFAGAAPAPEQQQPSTPPITLVLRNGQQVQVQNYAVMGSILWDFSTQPARKFPIANIDIDASTKATEANGGEFPSLNGQ